MQQIAITFASICIGMLVQMHASAELKPEPVGVVKELPVPYPAHWVIAHDASFFHMSDGKMIVLDADADTEPQQYKGMVNTAGIGQFNSSNARKELYVAETFYSRGQRGERTDVLTIYDQATLSALDEVVLPGGKRSLTMPEKHALQLIDNDSLLLVFNLTPATSVTVIDLEQRKVVNEVQIPGCSLMYPTGKRGFSSLCADGAFLVTQLDESGQTQKQTRGKPFFNIDEEPIFEKPAMINGTAYFPTFHGDMQPVDLSADAPKIGKRWSLLSKAERKAGWRPGGWQLLDKDVSGRVYILMHAEGFGGSHKDPGSEVWVYDVKMKKRVAKIALQNPAISLVLTQDKNPLLVTTTAEMVLDVYDAKQGKYLKTMKDFGQDTPFVVYAVN